MLSAGNRKLCEFAETCMDFTREITLGELISTFGTTVRRGTALLDFGGKGVLAVGAL